MGLFDGLLHTFDDRQYYDEHRVALDHHVGKFYSGDEVKVLTEIIVLDFRIDIILIESKQNMFNVIITSGMSSMAMTADEDIPNWDNLKFAELMMCVPNRINSKNLGNGGEYEWIIAMLKQTAKFPHYENTWFGVGHAVQGNIDCSPYDPNTEFVGGLILPSVTFDKDFTQVQVGENMINLYSFFPLYKNELEFKFANDYNAILDILIEKNISEVFLPDRENLLNLHKKKRFKF